MVPLEIHFSPYAYMYRRIYTVYIITSTSSRKNSTSETHASTLPRHILLILNKYITIGVVSDPYNLELGLGSCARVKGLWCFRRSEVCESSTGLFTICSADNYRVMSSREMRIDRPSCLLDRKSGRPDAYFSSNIGRRY